MKRDVKAIIFDVGGVLELGIYSKYPKHGHRLIGVHTYVAKKLRTSLDHWFDAIDSTYADSIEGKISESKTLSIISKNLEVPQKKLNKILYKAYKKNFKGNIRLYKKAYALKKKGYKIAILSDQWPPSKRALMPFKYTRHFDAVVVSCEAGMRKPNPEIYKKVLRELRLKPSQTLFIDNREWNLTPAKKLGMNTLLFTGNEKLFKQLKSIGVR